MDVSELIAEIAVPLNVAGTFHYRIPDKLSHLVSMGSLVQVPFRHTSTHGFVIRRLRESSLNPQKLKSVEEILVTEPLFSANLLKFIQWISQYYCHPVGECLASAVPRLYWTQLASTRKPITQEGVGSSLEGVFKTERPFELSAEQKIAVDTISNALDGRPVVVHGVTGSGKTEIYMCAIARVIEEGGGALVLAPEIALTPQLIARFESRFPGLVAVLHSGLTDRERFNEWQRLRTGRARIAVGARSALFAPLEVLKLIVVDEEHEHSYKQEDAPRYHARDSAIVRAQIEKAVVVLGSATPSVETYYNAHRGKYRYVHLPNRVHKRPLPKCEFVDLKRYQTKTAENRLPRWLSPELFQRIESTLSRGEQCLLFLNRLGYAHFLFCNDCGTTWRCKDCDISLTYYKSPPQLKCHYCGRCIPAPDVCHKCLGKSLQAIGFGTEQVASTLAHLFPKVRLARFDRGVIKTRKDLEKILLSIANRDVDIIIGTQMVAKGHDFPGISLVGVLIADATLNLPDFRANEKTFQLITQVSGRAGRADRLGQVIIQTLSPDHPILVYSSTQNSEAFYASELEMRRQARFPPFYRLAMIRFQHTHVSRVEGFARDTVHYLQNLNRAGKLNIAISGPAEAPIARVRKNFRWQCLLRATNVSKLQESLKYLQEYLKQQKTSVKTSIDVDPIHSL